MEDVEELFMKFQHRHDEYIVEAKEIMEKNQ